MNTENFKSVRGEEYPAADIHNGIRLPLSRESRFVRCYHSHEHRMASQVSRFADGSASITALELQQEWGNWTEELQMDFCQSCLYLFSQPDFPVMLRFIMEHGGHKHWCAIALPVARYIPRDEAFDFFVRALRSMNLTHTSNITQAIAATKHPEAEPLLRSHLVALWTNPALWSAAAEDMNWVGYDVTTCITRLIELGASPSDFLEQVRQLSGHVCSRNRDSCRRCLSKYYPEINFSK